MILVLRAPEPVRVELVPGFRTEIGLERAHVKRQLMDVIE